MKFNENADWLVRRQNKWFTFSQVLPFSEASFSNIFHILYFKPEFLSRNGVDILGQSPHCREAVVCTIGYLAESLASANKISVALLSLVMTTQSLSRLSNVLWSRIVPLPTHREPLA